MKKQRTQLNQEDDGEEGGDDWLLTYGDLMTQLVCFFVLLMSFSVINAMKFRDVVVSLHEALSGQGVLSAQSSVVGDVPLNIMNREIRDERLVDLEEEIKETLEGLGMSDHVDVEMRDKGLVIILKQQNPPVFFDTADARIKKQAYPILDQIGKLIAVLPNYISVEGHTDIRPINTPQFPSNWELSTMRATNVLRYLQIASAISPGKFSAAGYGPYRPIAPNDTEVGMSKNRRVEIVVLHRDESESLE
ncbi:flagellar motor protein MotB [Candidatus Poribacteria bacterium]